MQGLARWVQRLAFLTVVVGCCCLFWALRQGSSAQVVETLRWLASAILRPLPLGCLAVAVLARWLAEVLDGRVVEETPGGQRVHPLQSNLLDSNDADGPKSVFQPQAESRAARDRWRPRLEAHLKGRQSDVVGFVDELLAVAVHAGASDIHLQPLELSSRVALRVSGELQEVALVPQALHAQVVRRIKVLAELVSYDSRRPQDGRFSIDTPRGAVDLRVSILPTNHGEKVVLRLAMQDQSLFQLERLGMSAAQRQTFEDLLRRPQGVVVLTGPTGSGKTTTLYAGLTHIHQSRGESTNLATIEDPIEVDLPFLNQTRVQRSAGLSMGDSLRALLRQDPNVLMVGEIRDAETAHVAIQGGLSGHLILTTLHAESAIGVFPRLIDLGVEPFLVSSAIAATLSQRLVKRLCPECRHPVAVSRSQRQALRRRGVAPEGLTFQVAEGCSACERSGRRGRLGIFEILHVDAELRQMIAARASTVQLVEVARRKGMRSLWDAALALAAAGEIDLEEALGVAT